ncbi:hypothetical protein [Massilia cavernae]|uniref:hypothetical protein n=1 Tax=Massilia cavernae TaxID=2320864 RepID=UPI001C71F94E|nr:hypothetical protein [Massilia cavernae]
MHIIPVLLALAVAAGHASAEATWISAGDAAYKVIRKAYPRIKPRESRTAMAGAEKIHLLEVSSQELDKIARTLHRELRHCGGFMYHSSEAAGRLMLEAASSARPHSVRPAYAIMNQATVAPLLSRMQEKNISEIIAGLTAFANRYYTSAPGIDSSNWLKAKWTALGTGRDHISIEQYAHARYDQRSVIATIAGSDKAG